MEISTIPLYIPSPALTDSAFPFTHAQRSKKLYNLPTLSASNPTTQSPSTTTRILTLTQPNHFTRNAILQVYPLRRHRRRCVLRRRRARPERVHPSRLGIGMHIQQRLLQQLLCRLHLRLRAPRVDLHRSAG
ncbi:hypothetical protein FIBSPDRAFT_370252 [Athelia psychrophila]|uniref:Uncharacterized protein n=1 Tax=Athelia psychrophila TaxID=1759441 RepID=A0A167VGW1_9AGAM|nr:hypothetical protein FIBSPDRAFT_370252 [Fibularhizoctonia sp. CBS 109695]